MSILDRLQRIIKANVNRVLDRVEKPEGELAARVDELEDALQEGRAAAATYGATFRRMERERDQLKEKQAEWRTKARQALEAGDEDTARKALGEKVRLGERIANLEPGIKQGLETYEKLKHNLELLQDQLRDARAKLDELRARKRAAEAQKAFAGQLEKTGALSGGIDTQRAEHEVLQAEAEAEIGSELAGDGLADFDLEQKARDLQVDAELRALREELDKD